VNKVSQQSISLLPWIGKTAKFIDYFVADHMKENGIDLSKEQFIVLKYLNEKDGLIQNDLAFITNRTNRSYPHIMEIVEELQQGISDKDLEVVRKTMEQIQQNIKIKTNINQKQR
jgi:predicted PP-loop superfamily ATPase